MVVKFRSLTTNDQRLGKLLCFATSGDYTNPVAICVDEQGLFHTAMSNTLRLMEDSDTDFDPLKGGLCLNDGAGQE